MAPVVFLLLAGLAWPALVASAGAVELPSLEPLPEPALEGFDPEVRRLLYGHRKRLDALLGEPATPPDQLGRAFAEVGQLYLFYDLKAPAEVALRNAQLLLPDDHRWPYLLAVLLEDRGRITDTRRWLERAHALRPDDLPTLVRLARAELALGAAEAAAQRARQALDRHEHAALHQLLGRALLLEGDDEAALVHLLRAAELQPQASSLHQQIGTAYRRLGDEERARAHLRRAGPVAVELDDPVVEGLDQFAAGVYVHLTTGNRAFRAGDYPEAAAAYRRAAEADPGNASARLNLGAALARMGRPQEAIVEYERAAELDPRQPIVHFNLGTLHGELGDHERAVASFRRAVELDPRYRPGLFNLATALGHLGRFDEAAEVYQRLTELDPRDVASRISLATALVLDGREAAAGKGLEEALEAMPRSLALAQALARLLSSALDDGVREGRRALRIALLAFMAEQTVEGAETVAMALAEAGHFEEAAVWQGTVLEALDGDEGALLAARRRQLERYRNGLPARAPWRETGVLLPPPSGRHIADPDPLPLPALGGDAR